VSTSTKSTTPDVHTSAGLAPWLVTAAAMATLAGAGYHLSHTSAAKSVYYVIEARIVEHELPRGELSAIAIGDQKFSINLPASPPPPPLVPGQLVDVGKMGSAMTLQGSVRTADAAQLLLDAQWTIDGALTPVSERLMPAQWQLLSQQDARMEVRVTPMDQASAMQWQQKHADVTTHGP
jgi:hypothetical protein